jgi:hypothetical protein
MLLCLDGLDFNVVWENQYLNLLQDQHGLLQVPIHSRLKVPLSPQVWLSFLTGEMQPDMDFEYAGRLQRVMQMLIWFKRKIPYKFGTGIADTVRKRVKKQFPPLTQQTFVDLEGVLEINMPYYSHDHSGIDALGKLHKESPSAVMTRLLTQFEYDQYGIYNRAKDKIQQCQVLLAYLSYPDLVQHLGYSLPQIIFNHYKDLDAYVGHIKQNFPEMRLIIISDHGFDFAAGTHSSHGFFSSSSPIVPQPRKITDFYQLVKGCL